MGYNFSNAVPHTINHVQFIMDLKEAFQKLRIRYVTKIESDGQNSVMVFRSNSKKFNSTFEKVSRKEPIEPLPEVKVKYPTQAKFISDLRKSHKLTLKQMGKRTHINQTKLFRLEKGLIELTISEAVQLFDAFQLKWQNDFFSKHSIEAYNSGAKHHGNRLRKHKRTTAEN